MTYSGSGGGRGTISHYWYSFSGGFSGTIVRNGLAEAITGGTSQVIGPLTTQIGSGTATVSGGRTGAIPVYTPFYFTNGSQVLRSSDLAGTDLTAFGSTGTGVNQFYGAAGLALDSSRRIYVADTINDRIVRIDNMAGKNWTAIGSSGAAAGQFSGPNSVALDSLGRIYVADTRNNRIVRFDDMSGTNWVAFGAAGSGVGQFQAPSAVAVDRAGHIYVADTANSRIVRMDDMAGTNWTALTQSPVIGIYIYLIQSPVGVALDSIGRIYIGESTTAGSEVIRVDDMTGANWTSVVTGNNLTALSVDSSGNVFASGTTVAAMAGVGYFTTFSNRFGPTSEIVMIPVPSPVPPAIRLSAKALAFPSENTGVPSGSKAVTITNFGGSPLVFT
jgi:sugar lactone lactonase YvrE